MAAGLIRLLAVSALLLCLSSCAAASEGALEHLLGGRVEGDATRAAISGADGPLDALPLAIAHCTRFGRDAQFSRREGGRIVFACVPK